MFTFECLRFIPFDEIGVASQCCLAVSTSALSFWGRVEKIALTLGIPLRISARIYWSWKFTTWMGIGLTGFFEGCKPQFECGGVGNSFRVSGRNDGRVCKSRKIWTFVRYLDPTKTVDDYQKDKLFWKCFSLKFVHYIFSLRTRLVV